MANENLEQKAVNGTMWVFMERIALELFRFLTTIVLARLLGPREFGLVALTSIFLAISLTFIDSGFTKALIQKKNTDIKDESTIFFFNLFVSFLFVVFVNIIAGPAANYYNEPRLENILRALSTTLVLFAFSQIQQVILTKDLNFKIQFKANVTGTVCSGIIGIILAYKGLGVWALVIQSITEATLKTAILWLTSKWKPVYIFSRKSFTELYQFGMNLFVNDLLKALSENMYGLLIGRHYSPYNLGLYERSTKLASLVITNFQFSVQRVTFPLFAKVQNDKTILKSTVKKSLDLILFLVVPSMFLLAQVARPLTVVLLSEKWIEMVPYVQLFCIYWLFFPFSGVNNHLVLALGHARIILTQSMIIYTLQFILLLVTINAGITAIILGQIVSTMIRQVVLIYYAKKLINFGFAEQGLLFIRHLIPALLSIVPGYLLLAVIGNNYLLLMFQALSYIVAYLAISYFLKSPSLFTIASQIDRLVNKKKLANATLS